MIMTEKSYLYFIIIFAVAGLTMCSSESNNAVEEAEIVTEKILEEDLSIDNESVRKAKIIFYNMHTPLEMAQLFERAGAEYNPELLNSEENSKFYNSMKKLALNLGIYGVDLSYIRMFDQPQHAIDYLAVINQISRELGIPEDEVAFSIGRAEENIHNKDSLFKIAMDDFRAADRYLKNNDRETTAALITLGGWVEAIYISIKMLDPENPNKELMEHVAEQKYSLNSLTGLIKNCQNEISVSAYLVYLDKLKEAYDKIDIRYKKDDLVIDTVNKRIQAEDRQINVTMENINEIGTIIENLRNEMIRY